MTGKELAALRRAAKLSQGDLARRVGTGRHAVSYWECKPEVDRHAWAVCRMAEVLPLPAIPAYRPIGPVMPSWREAMERAEAAAFAAMLARSQARAAAAAARRRVRCNAKTRKGTACRCQSEPGKLRCKYHGGMSTGARTPEGRERIAEAQRRRWAQWRANRDLPQDG